MDLKYLLVIFSFACAATAARVSLQSASTINITGILFTAPDPKDGKELLARGNSTRRPWGDCYKQPQSLGRNAITKVSQKWIDNTLVYSIDSVFSEIEDEDLIFEAMETISQETCIQFVERTTQTDYVSITNNGTGCWSYVGRRRGKQVLNLQSPGCFPDVSTPIHEFYHALGIMHEHERNDRDTYIEVFMQNVDPKKVSQFDITKPDEGTTFGLPYDYESVMHYDTKAFTVNGEDTMRAKLPNAPAELGNNVGPTALDIQKLKMLYGCP